MIVKPISEFVREGQALPPSVRLFSDFILKFEAAIIFSDMGVGKTALGMQIARACAMGITIPGFPNECGAQRVLYCDFELSTRQLAGRYEDDGHFPANLLRLELDTQKIPVGMSLADAILGGLPSIIGKHDVEFLIIDNVTYMGEDLTQVEEAARLMKALKDIKDRTGITMLVVAHTPKRKDFEPLSINDLGGSRMIPNFVDSVFAIGKVKHDEQLRYLKQLKVRSEETKYGANNVAMCRLEKREGLLGFEFIECRREMDLIKGDGENMPQRDDRHEKILELIPRYLTLGAKPVTMNSLAQMMADDDTLSRDDRALLKNAKRIYEKLKDKFQARCGTKDEVVYMLDGGYAATIFYDPQRLRHIKTSASGWGVELTKPNPKDSF